MTDAPLQDVHAGGTVPQGVPGAATAPRGAAAPDASPASAGSSPSAESAAPAEPAASAESPAPDPAPAEASPPAVQAIAPPPPPEGVLVVDDSGHSRELLMSLLRRLTDVELRQARNGEDALAEFAARPARLTFLDIDMAGLDGLEVLRRLRASHPDAFIVMVSGVPSVENVRMALDEGAGCFVVKPFRPQRIIDALARYVKETGDRSILIGG